MLTLKPELTLPAAGLTGFEVPLSEDERAIQDCVHQFAKSVMRPIGRELDKMSAADVCAPSSPLWAVFQEAAKLGIPVVAVVDTNHSPENIAYVIPGNDDSSRAVRLYARGIADAVLEGKAAALQGVVQAAANDNDEEFVEVNEGQ